MRFKTNTTKGTKYNNRKVTFEGVKFDSELELTMYKILKKFKIPFQFQYKMPLQEGFKETVSLLKNTKGKPFVIRPITLIVDFYLELPDRMIIIDTKGFFTEESKIKFKLLRYQLHRKKQSYEIHLPKEPNKCLYLGKEIQKMFSDAGITLPKK